MAAYGRERQVVEEFDRLQQPDVSAHRNSLALGSFFFGLGQASFPLLVVLVFWYGGDKFAKGQINITSASHVPPSTASALADLGPLLT